MNYGTLIPVKVTKLLPKNRGVVGIRQDTGEEVYASFNTIGSGAEVGKVIEIHPSRFDVR